MIEADFNGGDVNRGEKIVNNGKPFFFPTLLGHLECLFLQD